MSAHLSDAKQIFHDARDIVDPAEQRQFVLTRCAGDPALQARVEELLRAAEESGGILDRSLNRLLPTDIGLQIPESVGTLIGPYKLMEQIGEGGFGLVFVAEQHQPVRRKVALKIIKPGMNTREVVARFEAERQALALMEHPNIAKVLDAGATPSGLPYFVMELVRGIPITEYCDKNQLATRDRLELFMAVCRAVQHAHQKGIIHRDIKPSNVLVTAHDGAPVVKLIDFGVAKALHQPLTDKTIYTRFTQLIGTPLYTSPEQAEMTGLDIDTRSDIYSLGVLLYELLTGSTPLIRERLATVAYQELVRIIREEEPPKPSTRLTQSSGTIASVSAHRKLEPHKLSKLLEGDLDWITMKALEKDRTRRYDSAGGLAADVLRYLQDEPVEACPPSQVYRLRKFARKHRGPVIAGGAIMALLVIGIAGTTWGMFRARQAEQAASDAERQAVQERDEKQLALRQVTDERNAKDAALVPRHASDLGLSRWGEIGEPLWNKEVPMNKKYIVRLSDAERRACEEVVKKLKGTSQKVRRAQLLLKVDADGPGWTDEKVCEAYGCRVQTVENVRQRCVMEGFELALEGVKRQTPPTPPLLDGEAEAKVIATRLGSPPAGYGRWTLRLLAEHIVELEIVESISHETVRQVLKKTG